MNRQSSHHLSPAKSYVHRFKGTAASSTEVLIITSYDYFIQKKGLLQLRKKYKEIILVPRTVDDDFLLNQTIKPLIEQYSNIHLVTNPQYDARYYVIYELVIKNNKSIRISTVFDFCERSLNKVYIPEIIDESNPYIPTQLTFSPKIRFIKNLIDFIISIVLFALSAPIWTISILRIRKDSPGPVFYLQERTGFKQKSFSCIKFRSMGMDAEQNGAQFSKKNDTRIFKYGALMRLTRIDELPQLLNILKGEVSLIGPRPERPVFIETFEEVIPYYNLRHGVKPGITGYAQVMYPYGAGVKDARHKLMYDLYYIKNWTISLEIKIIFMTAMVVLSRKGR
jgi:lipopolysaccharide/colanic/teichoic acid biosynthesis glycosyltransferase